MNRHLAGTLGVLVLFTPARALIVADHPDDICPPAADPCVVADRVQVVAPGVLDFGLRGVHVTGSGRFERTTSIYCGSFTSDVETTKIAADSSNGGGDAGSFTVTAQRACSGDGATPCLDDTVCVGGGLGTCSVGDGTIDMTGQFHSIGGPGGLIQLRAAGDIHVAGFLFVNSATAGQEGGEVRIDSFQGSVDIEAAIKGNAGAPQDYEPDEAGEVWIDAAVDARLAGPIELNGGYFGGFLKVTSGRDVLLEDDISSNGGGFQYAAGGYVWIVAGRDIVMTGAGSGTTRVRLNAGSKMEPYYGFAYPGSGGFVDFEAGRDIDLDSKAIIESRTPIGSCEASPYGGDIELAAVGQTRVDGFIVSSGGGVCGHGGTVWLEASDLVRLGENGEIDVDARIGGDVVLESNGRIEIDGRILARGTPPGYLYGFYSESGDVDVAGNADVTVRGQILTGSGEGWVSTPDIRFDVCRLDVEAGAEIDNTFGGIGGGGSTSFRIGESMTTAPGSEIGANGLVGGFNRIRYRDPAKPPVLLGSVSPAPVLQVDPSIPGCPVCGNLEVDQGESCDDGNTVSGDGCRADCQDEGCVAASPGYPGTPLCDDADACTVDVCDDQTHTCSNVASCEEGIACTIDSCVAGACQHVPDDAACDDASECTVDACSTTSGCTFTVQAGAPCDDGDWCTQSSSCHATSGACTASDASRTTHNRLVLKLGSGGDDDALKMKARLPLTEFTTSPAATGLVIRLQDSADDVVLSATIPASAFEDQGSGRYRFRDRNGDVAEALGIDSVVLRANEKRGHSKLAIKGSGMNVDAAAGQPGVTVSLLWGSDPAVDECLTARRLTCKSTAKSLKCSDP